MKINKLTIITAALSASMLLLAPGLTAQDAPATTQSGTTAPAAGGGGGNGGGPGGGQNWQQRMADRLKTSLKATDDEWAVIQPLLQKVQDLQRETRGGGGFGGGGFGRRGGGGNNGGNANAPTPPQTPTGEAAAALRTAVDSDSTSDADIKAKLQALRDARKKAQADLDAARADLQKVLTLRQEAVLVNMGILE